MKLRLGTRASLLAVAQSRLVAADLMRLHPGLQVELVTLQARGDRDLKTPLPQVNDANFFNAELDEALACGRVDVCVHSYKDLPANRPAELHLAALPEREDPRDVVLLHPRCAAKLQRSEALLIGSCSLRRQRHVADFLSWALPHESSPPTLEFADLRGAVEARLKQLFRSRDDGRVLDGVVLALAGLNRLYNDADGYRATAELLEPLRWLVVPLSAAPTASGQGALAVECRRDDAQTRALLAPLDHAPTRAALDAEAKLLGPDPGDAAAATVVPHEQLHQLRYLSDGAGETQLQPAQGGPEVAADGFDATRLSAYYQYQPIPLPASLASARAIYVSHHRCATLQRAAWPTAPRVWVSGTETWRRLAARGVWVEGCTDHLGFDALRETLDCRVLALPPLAEWAALTHEQAVDSWDDSGVGQVVAAYRRRPEALPTEFIEAVQEARQFFWSSPQQYQRLQHLVSADAQHAAGPGKTAQYLRNMGVQELQLFPSRQVWQQWLG